MHLDAQETTDRINVLWGEKLFLESKNVIPEIIGYDSTGFYALVQDYQWAIEHYNTDLDQARREYLSMSYGLRTRELEALVHFHGVLYLFTSEMRFRSRILYVQTIDKKTLLQNEDDHVLIEVRDMGGWRADFHFILSRLEQKLLIVSRTVIWGPKIQEVRFMVFGKGLIPEWESGDRIQHDRKIYSEAEFVVDEIGNAYMLCLYYQPVLFQHLSPRKNSYLIVAFSDQGKSVNRYFAEFPNKYIRGIAIEPNLENELACAGFYSPSINDYTIDGIFFFTVDHQYQIIRDLKFHEMESYLLEESMELKPGQQLKYLYSFYLDYLVLRQNGNFVLTAEQVFEQNYENHKNIIVMGMNPHGEILWKRVIQKIQNHDLDSYPDYTSYALFAPAWWNKVEILYNENLKNLERSPEKDQLPFNYNSKAYLSCVEIGEHGEMGENIIYLKKRKRMLTPAPLYFYDMKTNEMTMPALRFRKFKFMKLTFN